MASFQSIKSAAQSAASAANNIEDPSAARALKYLAQAVYELARYADDLDDEITKLKRR
jgi:hypothetical protein